MCQLLGMNSNMPTDICFSFTGFKARGGVTDQHADGWGVAFFDGPSVRILHDPQPSCSSPLADLVCAHPILATNIIAHIRKATHGDIRLENTHPFQRELWGRQWVFAHNGTLVNFAPTLDGSFHPVGTTDSEQAFCWLMQSLQQTFGATPPGREALFAWLQRCTVELAAYGVINFLFSNGDELFAHSSTRLSYLIRRPPFVDARLIDDDVSLNFGSCSQPSTHSVVIATTPLTDNEPWVCMPAGTLWCFSGGRVWRSAVTQPGPLTACSANSGQCA